MKNKQSGLVGILLTILIGIGLLYYFKIDVKGIFDYFLKNDFSYFSDAKKSVESTDWQGIVPTSTSR